MKTLNDNKQIIQWLKANETTGGDLLLTCHYLRDNNSIRFIKDLHFKEQHVLLQQLKKVPREILIKAIHVVLRKTPPGYLCSGNKSDERYADGGRTPGSRRKSDNSLVKNQAKTKSVSKTIRTKSSPVSVNVSFFKGMPEIDITDLNENSGKKKQLAALFNEMRDGIVDVIETLNFNEDLNLRISGNKTALLLQLNTCKEVTADALWTAIEENYEVDGGDDDSEEDDEEGDEDGEDKDSISNEILKMGYIISPKQLDKTHFDLSILNLDTDPATLVKRMNNFERLRMDKSLNISNMNALFWGPSGTGKSYFAQYLSSLTGKNIFMTSASSFLGKYVGETEKNIKKIFKAAEKKGWILFIDEVEGLIPQRSGTDQSWEMTSINEFLVNIETFKGVCIAATNLYESIDPAFYRRFSEKVKFDFMKNSVKEKFVLKKFSRMVSEKELSIPNKTRLDKIKHLTPGDLEAVYKRLVLDDCKYPTEFIVKEIEKELLSKKHTFSEKVGLAT